MAAVKLPKIPLVPQKRPDAIPLSFAQQRLWFLDRLHGTSREYNVVGALRLYGELDVSILKRAINTIVERHESLRTNFVEIGGEPAQIINPAKPIVLPVIDLSDFDESSQNRQILVELRSEWEQSFDLTRAPMLRVKLLKLGRGAHILIRTAHHIAWDVLSQGIFNREFAALIEAYHDGRNDPLKPLPIQYADFTLWQRSQPDYVMQRDLAYWKEQLAGIPEQLELPSDRSRPSRQKFEAQSCHLTLSTELLLGLKRISRTNQATLFMTLSAALGVLLSRYTGQNDIVLGSPIANRDESQLESLIGFFANSFAMRIRLKAEMSFRELLVEVRETALEAYQHQDAPFEKVVQELSPHRASDKSPIFSVTFAFQGAPSATPESKKLRVEVVHTEDLLVRADLEVYAREKEDRLTFSWVYNTSLFDRWRIEQMAQHLMRVLDSVVRDVDQDVRRIKLLAPEERDQILHEWNQTTVEFPSQSCIHELFEEQVKKTEQAIAVVFEDLALTYGELNRRANQLGHYLRNLGVKPEVPVAICIDRGLDLVIGLLAILKAGGACVPMDPEYPVERLREMLQDTAPPILLTQSHLQDRFSELEGVFTVVDCNSLSSRYRDQSESNLGCEAIGLAPEHLAYIIYTSGSNGRPKGVMLEHRGLCNLASAQIRDFSVIPESRILQFASFSFDACISEIFMALCRGASLHILRQNRLLDEGSLMRKVADSRITHATLPPAMLSALSDHAELCTVRTLTVAGDTLTHTLMKRWGGNRQLLNAYGPTETTVCATTYTCQADDSGNPPIGRPISNTRIYILDRYDEPVPVGITGEIHIGGVGVARGYLHLAQLTAARFVVDPFSSKTGARMFKSGDLGRWRPDGNIEFLGRNDDQVKIRGFRVEPGEIEVRLREYHGVREVAVVACEDTFGGKQLIAYYSSIETIEAPTATIDAKALRAHLSAKLPDYMLPAVYVKLEFLPLTPNGKLNRKALPPPELLKSYSSQVPRTFEEQMLCEIFADVLGAKQVGLQDEFFDLGGDSLRAVRLVDRISVALGIDIPLQLLFDVGTVSGIINWIKRDSDGLSEKN